MAGLKRLLRHFFLAIVALLLIFEEWGWDALARILAKLARLPFFAWLESKIRSLPPYAALATFFVPALMLLPIKLLALFFIGRGHALVGLIVLLAAKLAGTALLARLFALTQPALMRLDWFARWYPRWKRWKDDLIAQVKSSAAWTAAKDIKRRVLGAWHDFRKGFSAPD